MFSWQEYCYKIGEVDLKQVPANLEDLVDFAAEDADRSGLTRLKYSLRHQSQSHFGCPQMQTIRPSHAKTFLSWQELPAQAAFRCIPLPIQGKSKVLFIFLQPSFACFVIFAGRVDSKFVLFNSVFSMSDFLFDLLKTHSSSLVFRCHAHVKFTLQIIFAPFHYRYIMPPNHFLARVVQVLGFYYNF